MTFWACTVVGNFCYVIWPPANFQHLTTIRSWVWVMMSTIWLLLDYLRIFVIRVIGPLCMRSIVMICLQGVSITHIFEIPDPYLSICFATCRRYDEYRSHVDIKGHKVHSVSRILYRPMGQKHPQYFNIWNPRSLPICPFTKLYNFMRPRWKIKGVYSCVVNANVLILLSLLYRVYYRPTALQSPEQFLRGAVICTKTPSHWNRNVFDARLKQSRRWWPV